MKVSDLSGVALDWSVFEAEFGAAGFEFSPSFRPSTDWSVGGPIIERECIDLEYRPPGTVHEWIAVKGNHFSGGMTALEAAMRCYVASKLGNEISISKELLK